MDTAVDTAVVTRPVERRQLRQRLRRAFDFAQQQVQALVERDRGYYPMYTRDGKWRHDGELWTHWCEGFLPGMMWMFFDRTSEGDWATMARDYTLPLEERKHDRGVHDLNFVLGSSFGRMMEVSENPDHLDVLVTAGRTMSLRFRERGQYLHSFLGEASLFIDIMMNVDIVFRAAHHTHDRDLLRKAERHCRTSRRYLVRGDGSTCHEGLFDTDSGEFLRPSTQQGYRADSCWARGLAWSLYGFGSVYLQTQDETYRDTARLNAQYFLQHLPADGITPYDFDAPEGERPNDTSGSAIAAAGLLQLADLVTDHDEAERYRTAAFNLLDVLCRPPYLAIDQPAWEGILTQQIYHLPKGLGVGESCMFGDYFFVEAIDSALTLLEGEHPYSDEPADEPTAEADPEPA